MDRMLAKDTCLTDKKLTSVILGSYIVCQVVVKNKTQQTIEQSQINKTFDRTVSIRTLHSPSLVSQMSVKLLMP